MTKLVECDRGCVTVAGTIHAPYFTVQVAEGTAAKIRAAIDAEIAAAVEAAKKEWTGAGPVASAKWTREAVAKELYLADGRANQWEAHAFEKEGWLLRADAALRIADEKVEAERKRINAGHSAALDAINAAHEEERKLADSVRAAVPEGMEIDPAQKIYKHSYSAELVVPLRPKQPVAKPCPKCRKAASATRSAPNLMGCSDVQCRMYGVAIPVEDWNLLHYGPAPDLREEKAKAYKEGWEVGRHGGPTGNPYRAEASETTIRAGKLGLVVDDDEASETEEKP